MPLRLVAVALCALTLAGAARAEQQFPYTAYVTNDQVYVRSGPGENYYPAVKLERGTAVEVYRHDPGGWYAVRPPESCFSWVSAEYLKPTSGGLAVVTGDRVVARVGSAFSDVRDVIQVRLDRGEEVEVLEAKRFNTGPAAQTWYKIVPPAGEFRWISGKFLTRELTSDAPREQGPHNNLLLARRQRKEQEIKTEQPSPRQSEGPRAVNYDRPIEEPSQDRDQLSEDRNSKETAYEVPAEDRREARSRLVTRRPFAADLNAELDDLDLALSTMVAEEPSVWEFTDLKLRTEAVLDRAETAIERGRARTLLSKIERFAGIQSRFQTVMQVRDETDQKNRTLAAAVPAPTVAMPMSGPRYDGVGRLMPVVSREIGAPQFALVDDAGGVISYVTASPGMNLRPYIGHLVGISGTRGFLPAQGAQHLTAKRLDSLH